MRKGLSVPGVSVNNIPIGIVPNSFKFRLGKGDTNVRAASQGGGSVTSIHTEDAEKKIGMMGWKMYITDEVIAWVATWKELVGLNVITAVQPATAPKVAQHMSMTNDPDFEASADGTVEIIFEGDPLSNNF
jgi:hypothetical protein